jgi:hypothetical protein
MIVKSASDQLSPLLTDSELERALGVAKGWAAKDRVAKARIPYVKIGRSVRYRLSDVQAFIDASVRKSTSDRGACA